MKEDQLNIDETTLSVDLIDATEAVKDSRFADALKLLSKVKEVILQAGFQNFPTKIGYIQCESISNNVIDLLLVSKRITPLNKNKTPKEATKEDNLNTTISAPTRPPIAVPVKSPATIPSAGSIPVFTNRANT